mgnify:CR=1 FL=1
MIDGCIAQYFREIKITADGLVVFETDKDTCFPENIGKFCFVKEYKYGYSKLTIFKS